MKLNIQKIAYRAIPVLTALVVIVSCVAVPARAATSTVNGYTVIDYNDYISDVKVDGDNDVVTVILPDNMYSMTRRDIFGSDYKEGISPWVLAVYYWIDEPISAGVFCPSGAVNKRYLDLSNIPDGSIFTTTNRVEIEPVADDPTGIFEIVYRSRIAYYDADFKLIENQTSPAEELLYVPAEWEYEMKYEVAIKKPDGAKYCMTYFYFDVLSCPYNDAYTSYIYYEFAKPKLQMSISSLYRLQEQTGKTNKLLEDVINGTPEQGEAVGGAVDGMHDAAGELEDIGDQLAGVDKPDADSIDVSLDSLVPYNAMLAYTAPIQVLWENPTLLGMLSIVIALVIVSWVFFGKKV